MAKPVTTGNRWAYKIDPKSSAKCVEDTIRIFTLIFLLSLIIISLNGCVNSYVSPSRNHLYTCCTGSPVVIPGRIQVLHFSQSWPQMRKNLVLKNNSCGHLILKLIPKNFFFKTTHCKAERKASSFLNFAN